MTNRHTSRLPRLLLLAVLAGLGACTQPPSAVPAPTYAAESARPDKEIVDVAWMDIAFQRELKSAFTCQDMGILVTTRGYAEGEDISVTIGVGNGPKALDTTLHGKVDADGKARVRWPAMGCVDHELTPLLQSMRKAAPTEKPSRAHKQLRTAGPSKARKKAPQKAYRAPSPKLSNPETRPAAPHK